MSSMESLPSLEIPRVKETGYAKNYGEHALQAEVLIDYPDQPIFSE